MRYTRTRQHEDERMTEKWDALKEVKRGRRYEQDMGRGEEKKTNENDNN